MADHLMLAEGYSLMQRPPPAAPAHGPHALWTLQPYAGPGLDSGPPPGALAYGAFRPPPAFQPFQAVQPGADSGAPCSPVATLSHLVGMDAELIDEEALTSLELELGLHRVRELPELFLGQSEFDCFSDLGSAPPAGSVSC
uniref:Cbp/p300 interacting transactivator with Glu/Asp rich carboxy-terminal domain 4 n=1 Tax=Loxodonta africana TaxID=9785 RepID=G3TXW8_LOXAF